MYTITATNDAGNGVLQLTVGVTSGLNVTDPPTDVAVTRDEAGEVTFTCAASGVPAPAITWSPTPRAGGRLRIISNPAVADSEGFISVTSMLTVSNLMRSDAGHYTCIVSNDDTGPEIRVFTLQINCECIYI
jgi:hypothetical protein